MSDEVQAGQDPPTPSPVPQAGQDPPGTSPQPDLQSQIRQLREQLSAANKDAAANRVAAAELKKLQDAALTEQQRKEQELETLRKAGEEHTQRLRDQAIALELAENPGKYGIDPKWIKIIRRLLPTAEIELNQDGTVSVNSLKAAVAALIEENPDFKLVTETPGAPRDTSKPTNPARPANPAQPQRTWAEVATMGWGQALSGSKKD